MNRLTLVRPVRLSKRINNDLERAAKLYSERTGKHTPPLTYLRESAWRVALREIRRAEKQTGARNLP